MSHELRSPLNAILRYSETMQNEIFGPIENQKYLEYLGHIHSSGSHLHKLINNILDLSAVEAGLQELHEEKLDLARFSESAMSIVFPRAEACGVQLTNSIGHSVPQIFADERNMTQILVNLLTNPVKFTPDNGSVSLAADMVKDGSMVICVADNGVGMNRRGIEMALTVFGQVDRSIAREQEGMGLGLPLSKGLIEAHGGSLTIESAIGKGTKVRIHVPMERIIRHGAQLVQDGA